MKKAFKLFALSCAILCLSSCGGAPVSNESTADSKTPQSEQVEISDEKSLALEQINQFTLGMHSDFTIPMSDKNRLKLLEILNFDEWKEIPEDQGEHGIHVLFHFTENGQPILAVGSDSPYALISCDSDSMQGYTLPEESYQALKEFCCDLFSSEMLSESSNAKAAEAQLLEFNYAASEDSESYTSISNESLLSALCPSQWEFLPDNTDHANQTISLFKKEDDLYLPMILSQENNHTLITCVFFQGPDGTMQFTASDDVYKKVEELIADTNSVGSKEEKGSGRLYADFLGTVEPDENVEVIEKVINEGGYMAALYTDSGITNFLVEYGHMDEDGVSFIAEEEIINYPEFTKDQFLVLTAFLDGVLPSVRVTYDNEDGRNSYYLLVSGEDGSLLLTPAVGDEQTAVLGSLSTVFLEDISENNRTVKQSYVIDEEGSDIAFCPDGIIHDVVVEYGHFDENGIEFTPVSTIFQESTLSDSEMLVLKTYFGDTVPNLRVSYKSNPGQVSFYLFESGNDGSILMIPVEDWNDGTSTSNSSSSAQQSGQDEKERLTTIVSNYVNDQYGDKYPGIVMCDAVDGTQYSFHVFENVDGHTATFGWYNVDAETLIGEDTIFAKKIDFSKYQ